MATTAPTSRDLKKIQTYLKKVSGWLQKEKAFQGVVVSDIKAIKAKLNMRGGPNITPPPPPPPFR